MGKGKGSGKTPAALIVLLTEAVSKSSQIAVARDTGVPLSSIQKFLKGTSEPTTATLQKLAEYFGVSVAYLRGEENIYGFPNVDTNKDTRIDISGIYERRRDTVTAYAMAQTLQSATIRNIVVALLHLPEEKLEEVIMILEREGIILPATNNKEVP